MLKIIVFTLTLSSTLGSVFALDYFQPPGVFTNSPIESFKHQKSWFYHSKSGNVFIYQAYLPDFEENNVQYTVSKRLSSGYQIYITASKWITSEKINTSPTKTLITFSDTVNLPPSKTKLINSYFRDNILTIRIPSSN